MEEKPSAAGTPTGGLQKKNKTKETCVWVRKLSKKNGGPERDPINTERMKSENFGRPLQQGKPSGGKPRFLKPESN